MNYTADQITEKLTEYLEKYEQYQGMTLHVTDDFQVFQEKQHAVSHARQPGNACRYVFTWNHTTRKLHVSFDTQQEQAPTIDGVMDYNRHFS